MPVGGMLSDVLVTPQTALENERVAHRLPLHLPTTAFRRWVRDYGLQTDWGNWVTEIECLGRSCQGTSNCGAAGSALCSGRRVPPGGPEVFLKCWVLVARLTRGVLGPDSKRWTAGAGLLGSAVRILRLFQHPAAPS